MVNRHSLRLVELARVLPNRLNAGRPLGAEHFNAQELNLPVLEAVFAEPDVPERRGVRAGQRKERNFEVLAER